MEEESKTAQETARAVQEVAKTTGTALEIAKKAGPFLKRVFGPLVENAVGIASDRLGYYRLTQFYLLLDKTEKLLADRGVDAPKSVPPKLAVPLLEAATIEDDEGLHDLWARLLANAMDPNAPEIKRSFIGILKEFEASDAKLLSYVYQATRQMDAPVGPPHRLGDGSLVFRMSEMSEVVDLPKDQCELSLFNLDRLGCVILGVSRPLDDPGNTYHAMREGVIHLTALGKALVEACMK